MFNKIANIVRGLSIDTIEKARSGHPGLPLGCGEIGAVLFGNILKYDPTTPKWPDRDRFILSAGHGSSWLYSLLYLSGYDISLEDLKKFRQLNSKTPGHPDSWTHIIRKNKESGTIWSESLMCRDTVNNRSHGMFSNSESDISTFKATFLHIFIFIQISF
ncbi:unnamed protein product, partial [marine sediment metagenome]